MTDAQGVSHLVGEQVQDATVPVAAPQEALRSVLNDDVGLHDSIERPVPESARSRGSGSARRQNAPSLAVELPRDVVVRISPDRPQQRIEAVELLARDLAVDETLDASEVAAMADVVLAIFNLSETVTRK